MEAVAATAAAAARRVRWRDQDSLDGSGCEERVLYEVPGTPMLRRALARPFLGCYGWRTYLWEYCRGCFEFGDIRGGGKKEPLYAKQGPLWKLNATAKAGGAASLAQVTNWRWRLFFLRRGRTQEFAGLTYLSEKSSGEMNWACTLAGARFEELPAVDMEPPSPNTAYVAGTDLRQYRIAVGVEDGRPAPAAVPTTRRSSSERHAKAKDEDLLPGQLFPFQVCWSDAEASPQRLVVALDTKELRDEWLHALRALQAALPPAGRGGNLIGTRKASAGQRLSRSRSAGP